MASSHPAWSHWSDATVLDDYAMTTTTNQCEERGRSRWWDNNPRDVPRKEIAACQTTVQREFTKGGKEERYRERSVNVPSCGRVPVVAAVTGNVESTVREEILKDVRINYVGDGTIKGQRVTFMRDTGASISIAKTDLVCEHQMTGKYITCVLVDRCIRRYPEAIVHVNTPHYRGWLKVACIDTALYDLIIGNNILRPTDCDDSDVQNGGETNTAQTQETDECKQLLTDTVIFQRTQSVGHEELGNQVDHENEQNRLETTHNVDTQEVAETSEDCIRSEVRKIGQSKKVGYI